MIQDEEHLELLAIFHYILAALAGLLALFPIFHLLLGMRMLSGDMIHRRGPDPFTAIVGWLFVFFAGFAILCGFVYAVCMALAAVSLNQRRRYTFCLVMACVSCLFVPLGTVLGVLSILVLLRPSVRGLFGVSNAIPPSDPASHPTV